MAYGPAVVAYPTPPPPMGVSGGMQPQGQGSGNLFYKTRLCNKWRTGACPFGDKCTYAHGPGELRRVDMSQHHQVHQVQFQHQMPYGGIGGMGGIGGGQPSIPTTATTTSSGTSYRQQQATQQQQHLNKSQLYYKTRLCIRFMQSGYCVKGSECTFAHGYEDLRLLQSADERRREDQNADAAGRVDHHHHHDGDEDGNERDMHDAIHNEVQEKARAMSALIGVGQADAVVTEGEMKEAAASLEDGSAFREQPYSDDVARQ